jgi:hypothetical protein
VVEEDALRREAAMTPKTVRQLAVDALLEQIDAPAKSRRYEATCLKCSTSHKSWAAAERCARSHDGGGRVLVRLHW